MSWDLGLPMRAKSEATTPQNEPRSYAHLNGRGKRADNRWERLTGWDEDEDDDGFDGEEDDDSDGELEFGHGGTGDILGDVKLSLRGRNARKQEAEEDKYEVDMGRFQDGQVSYALSTFNLGTNERNVYRSQQPFANARKCTQTG